MKISTVVIWAFEFGAMIFLGVCAYKDKADAMDYFFIMGLVIILAIFGNKKLTVKAKGTEINVEDEKDGK